MARKKAEETVVDPPSDTNGHANGNGNGQAPRKVVKKFLAQSSKDTTIQVEVVENEFSTQTGEKVTYLSAVCTRLYKKADGSEGTSYSYRQHDIGTLVHLLNLAHGFIVGERVIQDDPFQ